MWKMGWFGVVRGHSRLRLAVLVELQLVIDRRTHDDSKYRAGIAARGKSAFAHMADASAKEL